jgi:hypothetical protein
MRTTTTLLVLACATFASAAFANRNTQSPPKTVKEVMTVMTIPASDAIFNGAAEPPTSNEGWASVRMGAVTLAESGRMLMTSGLARDKGPWMEMASALVKEAEAAVKAADAKDLKALEEVSDRLYVTCKACHDRYMAAN